jgi:hypothetical protein
MRKHYKNSDDISLTANGCDGCSPTVINGVFCHEIGCPDAWLDYPVECKWCGREFYPEIRGQEFCDENCAEPYCQ